MTSPIFIHFPHVSNQFSFQFHHVPHPRAKFKRSLHQSRCWSHYQMPKDLHRFTIIYHQTMLMMFMDFPHESAHLQGSRPAMPSGCARKKRRQICRQSKTSAAHCGSCASPRRQEVQQAACDGDVASSVTEMWGSSRMYLKILLL